VTDERLEKMIATILLGGVLAAATVVFIGGIRYLLQHHADPVQYSRFILNDPRLTSVRTIAQLSWHFRGDAIIQLGLVLLIATPVTRVALSAVAFYLERDRLYLGVSTIVLAILIFSLMHST